MLRFLAILLFITYAGPRGYALPVDTVHYGSFVVMKNANGLRYTPLLFNGPDANRFNLVFIGDGFTESQAEQENFEASVGRILQELWKNSPFAQYKSAFNVYRVNLISRSNKFDTNDLHSLTALQCKVKGNDTRIYYKSLLCDSAAKIACKSPNAVVVLINDKNHRGSTDELNQLSGISLGPYSIVTARHELGHNIANLGDEYGDTVFNTIYFGARIQTVNLTSDLTYDSVKWHHLFDKKLKLPNSINQADISIGAFRGGNGCVDSIWHPQKSCSMNSPMADNFCVVCDTAIARRLACYLPVNVPPGMQLANLSDKLEAMRFPLLLQFPNSIYTRFLAEKTTVSFIGEAKDYVFEILNPSFQPVTPEALVRQHDTLRIVYNEPYCGRFLIRISRTDSRRESPRPLQLKIVAQKGEKAIPL